MATLRTDILGGAAAGYDTLVKIQNELQNENSATANLMTAVGNRVRFDAAQRLTNAQKTQARVNIHAASATEVGDTSRNFVNDYTTARDA